MTVTGDFTHFTNASVVTFGNTAVTAGVPTAATATSLTVPVSITAAATLGATSVTVTSGIEVVTLNNGFSVGIPVITQLNPNTGVQGQSAAPITVTGSFTHFTNASVVTFGNTAQTNTTATFSAPGVYTLMLSADDCVHAVAYDAVVFNVVSGILLNATPAGTNLNLSWSGGAAPFVVEWTAALSPAAWSAFATTSVQNASVPITGGNGFFRMRGN